MTNICTNRVYNICQGYLIATRGITVRVRSLSDARCPDQFYFTLKVSTNGRVVEIENPIDRRDFNDLWDICLNKLEKTRYKLNGKYKGWEIDFFRDHDNQTYFVMAECEMPEGQVRPVEVPQQIKDALLYEVPLNDVRFSSKLLSDVRYAKRLLNEINGG
jgi:CYTH domain-containing protein